MTLQWCKNLDVNSICRAASRSRRRIRAGSLDGLLDDRPDQRGDPAEHSPAEHDIDQDDLAGVQNVAAHRYECGDQIEEGGIGRSVLFGGPVELRLW